MKIWARKIELPSAWADMNETLSDDLIPISVIRDLYDKEGALSVWHIDDNHRSYVELATLLQNKDTKRLGQMTFRIIGETEVLKFGLIQPTNTSGTCLDKAWGKVHHYEFPAKTINDVIKLVRAFSASGLTIHQFRQVAQSLGSGLSLRKSFMAVRIPRVNHESFPRAIFFG
jgi:hypothetical protein